MVSENRVRNILIRVFGDNTKVTVGSQNKNSTEWNKSDMEVLANRALGMGKKKLMRQKRLTSLDVKHLECFIEC